METLPDWPALLHPGWLRPYRSVPDLLAPEDLERLREGIRDSPYLADTTLNARFAGTRGFTVVFRRDGLEQVERHFPAFAPFLRRVLHPRCNAFYLNPLVIRRGSRVEPHRDRSLRSWVRPREPSYPVKVSVLYVQKPEDLEGGVLVLHRRKPIARFEPRPNLLVEFRGFLLHEVTEVRTASEEPPPRISLVCEQYRMGRALLDLLPDFAVKSKRAFGEFLEEAMGEAMEEPVEEPVEDAMQEAPEDPGMDGAESEPEATPS